MTTYSDAIVKSNKIAKELHVNAERLVNAYQGVVGVQSALDAMLVEYSAFVQDVNAKDSEDAEWTSMQGRVNKLVEEFHILGNYATAIRQAIEEVKNEKEGSDMGV